MEVNLSQQKLWRDWTFSIFCHPWLKTALEAIEFLKTMENQILVDKIMRDPYTGEYWTHIYHRSKP